MKVNPTPPPLSPPPEKTMPSHKNGFVQFFFYILGLYIFGFWKPRSKASIKRLGFYSGIWIILSNVERFVAILTIKLKQRLVFDVSYLFIGFNIANTL